MKCRSFLKIFSILFVFLSLSSFADIEPTGALSSRYQAPKKSPESEMYEWGFSLKWEPPLSGYTWADETYLSENLRKDALDELRSLFEKKAFHIKIKYIVPEYRYGPLEIQMHVSGEKVKVRQFLTELLEMKIADRKLGKLRPYIEETVAEIDLSMQKKTCSSIFEKQGGWRSFYKKIRSAVGM